MLEYKGVFVLRGRIGDSCKLPTALYLLSFLYFTDNHGKLSSRQNLLKVDLIYSRVKHLLSEVSCRQKIIHEPNNLETKICLCRHCDHYMTVIRIIDNDSDIHSMIYTTPENVH